MRGCQSQERAESGTDMKFSIVPSQATPFSRTWNSEKNGVYIWKIFSDFYTWPSTQYIIILSEHYLSIYKRANHNDTLCRIYAIILLDALHNYHVEAPWGSCWVEATHVFSEWKKRILECGLLRGLELVGQAKRTLQKRNFGNVHRESPGSLAEHQVACMHGQTPEGLGENNTQSAGSWAKAPEIRWGLETLYFQPTPVKGSRENSRNLDETSKRPCFRDKDHVLG